MPEAIAKHNIHRREGDFFEDIPPGVRFEAPQDELDALKKNGAIFDNEQEAKAYMRAIEGHTVTPSGGEIVRTRVPVQKKTLEDVLIEQVRGRDYGGSSYRDHSRSGEDNDAGEHTNDQELDAPPSEQGTQNVLGTRQRRATT